MMLLYTLLMILCVEYLGLASRIGILKAVKFSLLASLILFAILLARNGFGAMFRHTQIKLIMALIFLTALSIFHGLVRSYAFETFTQQVGYFILLANVFWLINSRSRIRLLAGAMVLFHLYLVATNLNVFFTSGRVGRFTAGYFLGDGNDFAWSLVTFLPFLVLWWDRSKAILFRVMLLASAAVMVFAIIGTGSRGASLGLAAQIGYYVVTSKKKTLAFVVLAVLLLGVLFFAPAEYRNRMGTIKDYDQDNSAQGRLRAWKAAAMMAVDHPFGVGAGSFNSAYGRFYRDKVVKEQRWGSGRWISAHSIYFLTLGEYGFPGLLLLLALLLVTFRRNLVFIRDTKSETEGIRGPPLYLTALNTSLVGYAVCGVFLGGINYPHLFVLLGVTLRCYSLIDNGEESIASTAPRSQAGRRKSISPARSMPRRSPGRRRTEP